MPSNLPATISTFSGDQVPARVANISRGGFLADCEAPVPVGSQVVLFLPSVGRLPAQVRWAMGNSIGAVFNGVLTGPLELGLRNLLASAPRRGVGGEQKRDPCHDRSKVA
ncbi:MAG: PilZ domain-containing protein [Allosphingosinicella sp.]|uniref:PilZ domain-containing protein n=1 Tax=Allosphingosinicella sp. TaxID=2823234 RepID=UPI00393CD496